MSENIDTGAKPAEPKAKKPPEPQTLAATDLRNPRDWALATGNGPQKTPGVEWFGNGAADGMSGLKGSVEHEVASVLHGWREHEHHENKPILLTREDYLAALAATHPEDKYEIETEGPKKGEPKRDPYGNPVLDAGHSGKIEPHPAALSPHKGNRVRTRLVDGKSVTERIEEKA